MVLSLVVNYLLSGGWGDAIYFAAGGIGVVSVLVIFWFVMMFLFRMRKGSDKNSLV